MSDCLITSVRILHVEARLASGSQQFVDADTMVRMCTYPPVQSMHNYL